MKNEKSRKGPDVPGLLRVPEVAERLGLAENTIYLWIETGRLAHVRIGRAVRVRPEALEELVRDVPAEWAR